MELCSAYAAFAFVAAIGLASPVRAEPFDPNEPANADFLATVRAAGVPDEPHGLVSGAQITVCPELDQGNPYQDIAGMLEKYSHFTPVQAHAYIVEAARHYCVRNLGNVP